MNIHPGLMKEAEQWLTRRLNPAVRAEEGEVFERWKAQDLRHAAAYAQAERQWERLAILQTSERLGRLLPPVQLEMEAPHRSPSAWRPALLAASVAVMALIAALWMGLRQEGNTYLTELGQQRTETLADGTTLRLNTASELDVHMDSARREIVLREGEAAFDVARDVSRPFVVSVGDGTVTAFGTHFQVRREEGRIAVTLIEGRVRIERASRRESEWLDPGQQAVFDEHTSGITRQNVDVKALTSWMSGRLEFNEIPLGEAVAEANRYARRKLRIADPRIADIPVSGTFRTGDTDTIAAAFEAAFAVRAEYSANGIVLRKGEEQEFRSPMR